MQFHDVGLIIIIVLMAGCWLIDRLCLKEQIATEQSNAGIDQRHNNCKLINRKMFKSIPMTQDEIQKLKQDARDILHDKANFINSFMGKG